MTEDRPDLAARGHTLPVGLQIGGVEITGLIGEGGFGIVYQAWDPSLQRRVALKEYMPSSLASRRADGPEVTVKSERHRETFEAGLKSFVNEARLLARFDHPGLVKVYRFWEAHGTAYMMMPFYEGPTLKSALDRRERPPDEILLRNWLEPLLDALALIHDQSCFHRDISPDNILLTPHGPLLLDFGAARRVIGDMTQALTVVLKPGYAPIEQYGESARMAQGAWTDLYALGCVLHYAITGRAPMTSVERLMDDSLPPLERVAAGQYSPRFLRAIDALLAVRPQQRPQDVAQFRALLAEPPAPRAEFAEAPTIVPVEATGSKRRLAGIVGAVCVMAAAGVGIALHRTAPRSVEPVPPPASSAVLHEPAPIVAARAASGPPPAGEAPVAKASAPALHVPAFASIRPAPRASAPSSLPSNPIPIPPVPVKHELSPRCSEILQKASLEAISEADAAYLKRECR